MEAIETTQFVVKSHESMIDYLSDTFLNINENTAINNCKKHFENLILKDFKAIQQNIFEINDNEKVLKYLNLQISLLSINHWKVVVYSEKSFPEQIDCVDEVILSSTSSELDDTYKKIKQEHFYSTLTFELLLIINEFIFRLKSIILELKNELYQNSNNKFEFPNNTSTILINENSVRKLQIPLSYSIPFFSALIACGKMKVEGYETLEYKTAANILCKSLVFLDKKLGLPIKESVVQKYLSYKTDNNQKEEFYECFNQYGNMFGFPEKQLN